MLVRPASVLLATLVACGGRTSDAPDRDVTPHAEDAGAPDGSQPEPIPADGSTPQPSPPMSSHPGSVTGCTSSADCPAGFGCAYPIGGGCGASGTCAALTTPCEDGVVCACDGTAISMCEFAAPKLAAKPTPSPVYSPPIPPGDISSDAWCANVIDHPSPSGCGLGVTIYQCPHGAYTTGCAEIVPYPGTGFPRMDVDAAPIVYPPGCIAQLAGCTDGFSATPAPLACYCQNTPISDGGYSWVCPD